MTNVLEIASWLNPSEVKRKVREGYRLQKRITEHLVVKHISLESVLGEFEEEIETTMRTPFRLIGIVSYYVLHPLKSMQANSLVENQPVFPYKN